MVAQWELHLLWDGQITDGEIDYVQYKNRIKMLYCMYSQEHSVISSTHVL